jgi:hypothetical protein
LLNPIVIYLDQYHWIDLAKAYHKRDKGEYLDLLNKVQRAIQKGRVIFPISIFHVVEALKEEDIPRCKRFAQVILEISQGWIIAPPWQVVPQELELVVEGVSNRQPQVFKKHPSLNNIDSLFTIYDEDANQEAVGKYQAMIDDYSRKIEKARVSQDGKAYS